MVSTAIERIIFMQEKGIEKKLVEVVRKAGGIAYKFVSPGNVGVPDRIVVLKGTTIFVELKTDEGYLSKKQMMQIKRLKGLKQKVEVIRGMEGLKEFRKKYGI